MAVRLPVFAPGAQPGQPPVGTTQPLVRLSSTIGPGVSASSPPQFPVPPRTNSSGTSPRGGFLPPSGPATNSSGTSPRGAPARQPVIVRLPPNQAQASAPLQASVVAPLASANASASAMPRPLVAPPLGQANGYGQSLSAATGVTRVVSKEYTPVSREYTPVPRQYSRDGSAAVPLISERPIITQTFAQAVAPSGRFCSKENSGSIPTYAWPQVISVEGAAAKKNAEEEELVRRTVERPRATCVPQIGPIIYPVASSAPTHCVPQLRPTIYPVASKAPTLCVPQLRPTIYPVASKAPTFCVPQLRPTIYPIKTQAEEDALAQKGAECTKEAVANAVVAPAILKEVTKPKAKVGANEDPTLVRSMSESFDEWKAKADAAATGRRMPTEERWEEADTSEPEDDDPEAEMREAKIKAEVASLFASLGPILRQHRTPQMVVDSNAVSSGCEAFDEWLEEYKAMSA